MISAIQTTKINTLIHQSVIFLLLFLALSSGLGKSIDKIAVVLILIQVGIFFDFRTNLNQPKLLLVLVMFTYILITSIFNQTFKVMVFYPVFGILLVFTFLESKDYLRILNNVLLCYIILCLFGTIAAYLTGSNIFVTSLANKGFPFILPTLGLTTTVQSYGSICMLWLVLHLNLKEKIFDLPFVFVSLAILLTFNRSTFLFYLVVMSLYSRIFLFVVFALFAFVYAVFFEAINSFIFNQSSINSRSELLQGFYISFWNENSFVGYLLGKANNFYDPMVLQQVKWGHRPDIENLYAMLLHTYGFIGLIFYLSSVFILLVYIFMKKNYKLFCIAGFYFFVTQYFTQEIVTNIFYLFLSVVLLIQDFKGENSSNQCDHRFIWCK